MMPYKFFLMKDIVFLITVLIFSLIPASEAQTTEELAKRAAKGLCTCVNETYSDIDNDVKRAMAKIIQYQIQDNKRAIESYVTKLSTDLTNRIRKQAGKLEKNDKGITEKQFYAGMIESMKETTGCKFAYIIMELGLKRQAKAKARNNQVIISQVKSTSSPKKYER